MHRSGIYVFLMLSLIALGSLISRGEPAVPNASDIRPLTSRQREFSIPFEVSQIQPSEEQPSEIQLYYSGDLGQNWMLYSRQRPNARQFQFRTFQDGEYWFHVRTLNQMGQLHPSDQFQPELKVIVDTVPPKLEFEVHRGSAGETLSKWRAYDLQINPESIDIRYRVGKSTTWQPVAVEQATLTSPTMLSGQVTWWPATGSNHFTVRAEVRDWAGNTTVVHRPLHLTNVVQTQPPGNQFAKYRSESEAASNSNSQPSNPVIPSPTPWPVDHTTLGSTPSNSQTETATSQSLPLTVDQQNDLSIDPSTLADQAPPLASSTPSTRGDRLLISETTVSPLPELPENAVVKMTDSHVFQLEYAVAAVGPSGIRKVELWATRDGGKQWAPWMMDPDNKSPLEVAVEKDGVYGFRVIVENGLGMAPPTPQPGDMAEFWIGVDTTQPQVQITSAQYGTGEDTGRLVITWDTSDPHLVARPITILASDRPGTGFVEIARELENNGKYVWQVDPKVPRKVFLRLEARDQAGNIGVHDVPEPINIEGLIPRATIRSIRPVQYFHDGSYRNQLAR